MNKVTALWALAAVSLLCGCMTSRTTDTERTAVEQLLLSTAADRAIKQMPMTALKGKKVFFDPSNLECYDKPYVVGTIRDMLGAKGALLVNEAEQAEVLVEARSGALAIDRSDSLIGMPSVGVPIPFAGTVQLPEIALFKKITQIAEAKLALHALKTDTGEHILSTGPKSGSAYYNRWWILFIIAFRTTDVPGK